ncbi:MAG: Zn-ribbon domain-containing OB-fold protein [Pseudorhodoplanes sp.]
MNAGQQIAGSTKYWRRAPGGGAELLAACCTQCGTYYLPRVTICNTCRNASFDVKPLSPVGNLYSYTVIHVPPPGYPSPYAIGYVDFPEKVRVFGQIRLPEGKDVPCDTPVTVDVATLMFRPDGEKVEGYIFVPRENASEGRT